MKYLLWQADIEFLQGILFVLNQGGCTAISQTEMFYFVHPERK
jgi:hypothetical protein